MLASPPLATWLHVEASPCSVIHTTIVSDKGKRQQSRLGQYP
jgi:hypothetical protein